MFTRVLAVVGQPGAGKDEAADYLATKYFVKTGGGDFMRGELRKLGMPTDREAVNKFAKEQRKIHGNAYPYNNGMLDDIRVNTVISGIRNTEELSLLKEKFGSKFKLIAVIAPIELRYQRIHGRGREGDLISFEEFKAQEEMERSDSSGSHEVDALLEQADCFIDNAGSKEDLYKNIDQVLLKIQEV